MTCQNSTLTCLSCVQGYYLNSSNACAASCPSGYFENSGVCTACAAGVCATCFGGSAAECITCQAPYYLQSTSCVLNCTAGFYKNILSQACEPCLSSCATCDGAAAFCTSCSPVAPLFLDTTTSPPRCAASCPSHYYADNTTYTCTACTYGCSL